MKLRYFNMNTSLPLSVALKKKKTATAVRYHFNIHMFDIYKLEERWSLFIINIFWGRSENSFMNSNIINISGFSLSNSNLLARRSHYWKLTENHKLILQLALFRNSYHHIHVCAIVGSINLPRNTGRKGLWQLYWQL